MFTPSVVNPFPLEIDYLTHILALIVHTCPVASFSSLCTGCMLTQVDALKELCHHISVFLVTKAGWGSPLSNQVRGRCGFVTSRSRHLPVPGWPLSIYKPVVFSDCIMLQKVQQVHC